MKQKISFIATVFNEEKNIKKFLESILNQTKKPDEIIIVDGGSKDKTYKILKEYSKRNKKIRVIQKEGANIAKGRNLAISKAKGEIIFVSDAGCVINKDWIKETLKFFPEADVVVGNYKAIVKNNFEYFQSKIVIKEVNRPSRMSSRNIAFKKICWKIVGGYPENFLTGEDTAFNLRLRKKGFKIKVNPNKLVTWEMRSNLIQFLRQFYLYGKGDKKQGNLIKMKKNLIFVFVFWLYILLFVSLLLWFPIISLILVVVPLAYLFLKGIQFFVETRKISALVYIPLLIFLKRISYIMGASFG